MLNENPTRTQCSRSWASFKSSLMLFQKETDAYSQKQQMSNTLCLCVCVCVFGGGVYIYIYIYFKL